MAWVDVPLPFALVCPGDLFSRRVGPKSESAELEMRLRKRARALVCLPLAT